MAQPADSPARQLAETLVSRQETALTERGLELGAQYQVSHAEQAQLATETANNAVPDQIIGKLARMVKQDGLTAKSNSMYNGSVSLPSNDSQLKHILRDAEGHLPDTPETRTLLIDLENDSTKFAGIDQYGNAWNVEILNDGTQNWVRHQRGVINEGGKTQSLFRGIATRDFLKSLHNGEKRNESI